MKKQLEDEKRMKEEQERLMKEKQKTLERNMGGGGSKQEVKSK